MEELSADSRSTAMSNITTSSSSTIRFLGLIKQPESDSFTQTRIHDQLELHESDVVWSFAVAPDPYSCPNPTSPPPPPPSHHTRHCFNPAKSGLSAALSDDQHELIRRKSTVNQNIISPAVRQEGIPARFPQSAPVNIPTWPKERYKNGDLIRVDEMEYDDDGVNENEELVPPHVIVARSHVTFSVFEGVGRTLKGRDLRRVRNAVFQKTGFID